MVDITPRITEGRQIISGYGDRKFIINSREYLTSVIVFQDKVIEWKVSDFSEVSESTLKTLFDSFAGVDLVIIGCGLIFQPPSVEIRKLFKQKNIILEVMDTGAACRTFNVLQSEDRRVAAALIKV